MQTCVSLLGWLALGLGVVLGIWSGWVYAHTLTGLMPPPLPRRKDAQTTKD